MPRSDAKKGCDYLGSFADRCGANVMMGDRYCHEHVGMACAVCGGQAVSNCTDDGPAGAPCGFPLCAKAACRGSHSKQWHS